MAWLHSVVLSVLVLIGLLLGFSPSVKDSGAPPMPAIPPGSTTETTNSVLSPEKAPVNDCEETYRNQLYGFDLGIQCDKSPWGYISSVQDISQGRLIFPFLLALDMCSVNEKGSEWCGNGITDDPDLLIQQYTGQDLASSPFSFGDKVTSHRSITFGGEPAEVLYFKIPSESQTLSGREVNIRHGAYIYSLWATDVEEQYISDSALLQFLAANIHFIQ